MSEQSPSWPWKKIAWVAMGLLLCYHAIRGASDGGDFQYHYWGAQRAWEQRGDLFQLSWIYIPTASLLLMPLGMFPYHVAFGIWTLFRFVALIGILWMAYRWAKKEGWVREESASWALWLALLFAIRPVLADFRHAQINLILFAIVSSGCLLSIATTKSQWLGGGLIALGGMLKGPPLLLLGFPLLQKRWRALLGAALVVAVLLLFSRMWFGAENHAKNWQDWTATSHKKVLAHPWRERLISIPELVLFVGEKSGVEWSGEAAQKAWLVEAALLGAAFLAIRKRRQANGIAVTPMWDWSCLGLGMALISPMTGLHHLVSLLPAMVLLVGAAFGGHDPMQLSRARRLCLLFAGGLLLFGNLTPHGEWFLGLPDFTILLALLLLAGNLLSLPLPEKGNR